MTLRIVIGIDPGQSGAVGALADGLFDRVWDMSTLERAAGGFHVDGLALAAGLRELVRAHPGATFRAVLEQVSARPKQGVTSAFRFGESYGVVRGVLGAMGIPFVEVRPNQWKPEAGLVGPEKNAARLHAVAKFPRAAPDLARKKDHGRAEALLIAHWSCAKAAA